MPKPLTIVLKLKPDSQSKAKITEALGTIAANMSANPYIDFSRITRVHFMRWVLVPNDRARQPEFLLFSSNYDGSLRAHLDELISSMTDTGVEAIWGACEGSPEQKSHDRSAYKSAFYAYALRNSIITEAFYTGYIGKTVEEIRRNAQLRENFQNRLDEAEASGHVPDKMRGLLDKLPTIQGNYGSPSDVKRADVLKLLALIGDLIASLPLVFIYRPLMNRIRGREKALAMLLHDDGKTFRDQIDFNEDQYVQNQLTVISEVKPGWWQRARLRLVLLAIARFHKHIDNQGSLGGIATIHCARWTLFDNGRYLFFESNYDFSWPSYIGDFVDKAFAGMDLIWKSAPLYPSSSREFERFKDIIRRNQVRTDVFYSAHPNLSIKNILNDARLARTLKDNNALDLAQG